MAAPRHVAAAGAGATTRGAVATARGSDTRWVTRVLVGDSKMWCLQMVERAGYTSLDILDGDCVRPGPRTQASNCDTSLKAVTKLPPSGSSTTSRQGGGGGGGGYMSLGTFFHNEDDSPLLVTSIDGLSAAGSAVSLMCFSIYSLVLNLTASMVSCSQ